MREHDKKIILNGNMLDSESVYVDDMLKHAYEDLNSFIYTVSHEMKTPARVIDLYAKFIAEDNEGNLLPQSIKDIDSIHSTCQNMMLMIQHMMDYSKAGIKVLEKKRIDMTILVKQCFDTQIASQRNSSIVLEVDPLPDLYGDIFLIQLLLHNLISNSVKFSRGRPNSKIWVSARVGKGKVEYIVKDNGVGFDQMYADRLFEPFQRLQNEGTYEGNGIGLAIVDRIAKRFGGGVSIFGKLDEGCEVRVWFPDRFLYADQSEKNCDRSVVKIGIIGDFTGRCPLNEQGKLGAYQLAAEEINRDGGINGKPVELLIRDDLGDNEHTTCAAKELTETEKVDVLMGSTLSPARDIMRVFANQNKTLYIDTQQTEGGVADHYTFCVSAMPEHQMEHLLKHLIQKNREKCYIITSDYNFGILSAEWAKYLVHKFGGEVVGCEYLDDEISEFDSLINRILKMESEILISVCVFPNHDHFFLRWHQRGLNHIPIVSTMVAAETYQHIGLPAPVLENIYVMASYLEDLETPAARRFTKRFRARFDKETVPYLGMDTEAAYSAMYLYKYAVEQAGTTAVEAVIAALESGSVYFDGPGGRVQVRGQDHHTARRMSAFRIDAEHRIREVFRTGAIHSDYIERMIEDTTGIKGGMRKLGPNVLPTQYNMLLNKLRSGQKNSRT